MSADKPTRPPGALRQSQVVTTFGPGAMVDLPTRSVLVGGLDHWYGAARLVREDRLARHVAKLLELETVELRAPPAPQNDADAGSGIVTFVFPEWFLAQHVEEHRGVRSRPLVRWTALDDNHTRYTAPGGRKVPVVPIRFVQGCPRGHISDIDWVRFVHTDRGSFDCRLPLWLDEGGTSGDLAELWVRCTCGARRPMSQMKIPGSRVLGDCRGRRPWLGPSSDEACVDPGAADGGPHENRLLVRSASNAYFPQVVSVISIPDHQEALRKAVDAVWEDFLQYSEGPDDVRKERKRARVAAALEGLSDDKVWAEVKRRLDGLGTGGEDRPIKVVEVETLLDSAEEVGEDVPDGDFWARTIPRSRRSDALHPAVDRVVLVHRLREVVAQIGFTRFEPMLTSEDGELDLPVKPAALAADLRWVPSIENRGEGVFVSFDRGRIEAWARRPEVTHRARQMEAGWQLWLAERGVPSRAGFGVAYTMLHTLSHLLLTAVSLECGYAASSIRERVYAGPAGYGILLYTGSSDAEGTLGGLVQVGRRLERHLEAALELGRLCSNDPVCAQHEPADTNQRRFLHGAACHGCVLIAETSCERRNEWLDRALVVPTVEHADVAFFAPGGG